MLPKLFISANIPLLEKKVIEAVGNIYPTFSNVTKLEKIKHPEIFMLYSLDSNFTVEDVRDFLFFFRHKPAFAEIKTGIIFIADNLPEQAQNLLLKFLEEHPQYVTLLLATTSKHSILPTIFSRVQPVYLADLDTNKEENMSEVLHLLERSILDRQNFDIQALNKLIQNQELTPELINKLGIFLTGNNNLNIKTKKQILDIINSYNSWLKVNLPYKQATYFLLVKLRQIVHNTN